MSRRTDCAEALHAHPPRGRSPSPADRCSPALSPPDQPVKQRESLRLARLDRRLGQFDQCARNIEGACRLGHVAHGLGEQIIGARRPTRRSSSAAFSGKRSARALRRRQPSQSVSCARTTDLIVANRAFGQHLLPGRRRCGGRALSIVAGDGRWSSVTTNGATFAIGRRSRARSSMRRPPCRRAFKMRSTDLTPESRHAQQFSRLAAFTSTGNGRDAQAPRRASDPCADPTCLRPSVASSSTSNP